MPPLKTDEDILNTIPGLDDNDAGDTGGTSETGATSTSATDATTQSGGANGDAAGAGARGGGGDANDVAAQGNKPGQQQAQPQKPQAPNTRGPVDLVDPKTGQVIARGGAERRYYDDAQRYKKLHDRVQNDYTQLQGRVRELEAATNIGKELGLTPTQQVTAMRAMSDLMRDPVNTLKAIIADMRAANINLDGVLSDVSGIDMAAINKTIDNKLQPVLKPQQQAEQERELRNDAQRTLETFLDKHQDAEHNLDVISNLMRETNLDLQGAYVEMIKWAYINGYDPTQPLMPQMQARVSESGQEQQPQQPQRAPANTQQATTPQPSKPLPNGRTTVADTSSSIEEVSDNTVYNENAKWRDILRREFTTHGLRAPN